ncbi:M28 family metallopeptidase [Flavobacteriaceae bacterium LMO-SS05]
MKVFIFASALSLVGSCATQRYTDKIQNIKDSIVFRDKLQINLFANSITANELKNEVYQLSSDDFQGRKTGELGFDKVTKYLKDYYEGEGISSPLGKDYFQRIPQSFFFNNMNSSKNVVAYIKGSKFPEEVLIISAHADHLGIKENKIYHGADDNGSGTAAIMEIAQAFKKAENEGFAPKRSILFLHLTGEEEGLEGSRYYTTHPIFSLENTIANLNIDMIGRIDKIHEANSNYIYLIGSDRLSTELHYISEAANHEFTQLELDYRYNEEDDANSYYTRSDQFNFAKYNIPVIFYFNGEHADYHQPSDTAEKLNYPLLEKRTKLIFSTAWYLANRDKRIVLDK